MERFFRSLKTENMPKNGYENETVANDFVRDYVYKYKEFGKTSQP